MACRVDQDQSLAHILRQYLQLFLLLRQCIHLLCNLCLQPHDLSGKRLQLGISRDLRRRIQIDMPELAADIG